MRSFWHDTWGCARGPIAGLVPQSRLGVGTILFAACMIAPTSTMQGALLALAIATAWLGMCRPPFAVVRRAGLLGLAALLPYFLVVALLARGSASTDTREAMVMAAGLLVRGLCCLLVSVATITTLRASELRAALVALPVPGTAAAILLQIIHQTATLAYETRRVASAIAIRGASRSGLAAWRLLSSLPRVWLPRIVQRADRTAAAMELRGYCEPSAEHREKMRRVDATAVAVALSVLALAIATRWWSPR